MNLRQFLQGLNVTRLVVQLSRQVFYAMEANSLKEVPPQFFQSIQFDFFPAVHLEYWIHVKQLEPLPATNVAIQVA